jgi:NAD(P)-dependent dehydrogenase (short-subunit alcohol dehydrogenase family)
LTGRRALVTGGAAGIGRAIALKLAREACDILLIDVDEQTSMATADEIRSLGRQVTVAVGDVADARYEAEYITGAAYDVTGGLWMT